MRYACATPKRKNNALSRCLNLIYCQYFVPLMAICHYTIIPYLFLLVLLISAYFCLCFNFLLPFYCLHCLCTSYNVFAISSIYWCKIKFCVSLLLSHNKLNFMCNNSCNNTFSLTKGNMRFPYSSGLIIRIRAHLFV